MLFYDGEKIKEFVPILLTKPNEWNDYSKS